MGINMENEEEENIPDPIEEAVEEAIEEAE